MSGALTPRSLTNKLDQLDQTWYRYQMARQVNLYEAKTQLSQLVDAAARGEEIVIAKNGKPMARLVPQSATIAQRKRALGQWRKTIDPLFHSDTTRFWREWKGTDETIEEDFARAAGLGERDAPGWQDTSSIRMPSSGRKRSPKRSAHKRVKR